MKVPLLELAAGMVETVFQAVIGGLRKILGQVKRQLVGLPMVFSCLAVLALPVAAVSEESTEAATYLGPAPGVRLFYEAENGQKMEIRGLTYDQDGALLIEERSTLTMLRTAFNAGCSTEMTTVYGLSTNGSKIIRKDFPLHGMTGYHTDLDLGGAVWGEEVHLVERGSRSTDKGKKTTAQCSISKRSKQKFFGKERTVIEVSGEYCVPRTYASGIGIIDYAGFRLVRIEKHGEIVFTLR